MINLVADHNATGHFGALKRCWDSDEWAEIWEVLDVRLLDFAEIDLTKDSSDDVVWQRCQEFNCVLLTNNRNDDGPKSLEATIREYNQPDSLPVFTIGDGERLVRESEYAMRAAVRIMEYLMDLDKVLGAGRPFVP